MSRRSQARDLEHEIDAQTDALFSQVTGRPLGRRIDRREPSAGALIHTWLTLRYEVAQHIAADRGF
jgi:hypothetical protein